MKKRFTWRSLMVAPTLAFALLLLSSTVANAVPAIGLTLDNQLVRFDTDTPGTIISTVPITGLQTNEIIHGIDFRTATDQLFGLGSRRNIYIIDPATGVATAVNSAPFAPPLTGSSFGVDFNPVVDRLRVVSNRDENFRFNPNTGQVAAVDPHLAYASGDPNEGTDPNVVDVAYNNNFSGATLTTLYGIDYVLDVLVRIGGVNGTPSPNTGQLTTIGSLHADASSINGFDIAPGSGTAFAAFRSASNISTLYRINLVTGAATLVGRIGGTNALRGLSIVTVTIRAVGVSEDNDLLSFDVERPGTIFQKVAITGLQSGETILALDYRPSTFQLYGLGSTGRLYTLNPNTGEATEVGSGPFSVALSGTSFGFDFNPTVDRIRVVSDADQNLRLNPDDGTVVSVDTPLAYAAGDAHAGANPGVGGSAYTNSFSGALTTTLYGIDTDLDILVRQGGAGGPNDGQLNTIGNLGVNAVGPIGFDIVTGFTVPGDFAYVAITGTGGVSRLYTINPATGRVSLVGVIGGSERIVGFAARPDLVITN